MLPEVKRRLWEAALPAGPSDEGVVKAGHIVSLNRFEAEAARASSAAADAPGPSSSKHKTLFMQMFAQLHGLDPKVGPMHTRASSAGTRPHGHPQCTGRPNAQAARPVPLSAPASPPLPCPQVIRRRDRAFKVKFTGEGSDDYGGPYREAITNACAELQSAASGLFVRAPGADHAHRAQKLPVHSVPRAPLRSLHCPCSVDRCDRCTVRVLQVLTPNGQHGAGNNRSAYTIAPSVPDPARLAQFAFFGKLLGCAMLQRELVRSRACGTRRPYSPAPTPTPTPVASFYGRAHAR